MVSILFTKVLEDAARGTRNAKYGDERLRDFLRDKALQAKSRNINPNKLMGTQKAKANMSAFPVPGSMLCFFYDAKHKATLPYWDKFPLIFPIEFKKDRFIGVNLHYLPPVYRARLMDALYETLNNQKYDETSRLKINYGILKSAAKFKYFKPCIKTYLYSHVQSKFITIDIREWDYALLLPVQRFQKQKARKVWDDSIDMIMKG